MILCTAVTGLSFVGGVSFAAASQEVRDYTNLSPEELQELADSYANGTGELQGYDGYSDDLSGSSDDLSGSSDIEELQKQQQKTTEKLKNAEKKRDESVEELGNIDDESKKLNSKLTEITDRLSEIDKKISAANTEIDETQSDIDETEARMEELQKIQSHRHAQMKQLMVFYYENKGRMDLFSLFITSKSFAQFLNRTEMASALAEYDKKVIEDYKTAEEEIMETQSKLEIATTRLKSRKKELKSSQKEMDKLMASVQDDVEENASDREAAAKRVAKYERKIVSLKMDMEALQASVAKAQVEEAKRIAQAMAASKAEGEEREDTTGAYSASASDVTLLAATIEAEAGNQSYLGKQAVASVVMNRVKSSHFPNTIYGVITQKQQFASYRSGMVDAYIEKGPSDDCIEIAQAAIDGERVGDWLFFMTVPYADYYGITGYEVIGDHAFFYVWGDN